MTNPLQNIVEKIEDGKLWGVLTFANIDIDSALDNREQREFDAEWMRVYTALQEEIFDEAQAKELDYIRELAFKKVYEHTENSDLAAFVSDDFEILYKSLIAGFQDPWLSGLFESNLNHVFPTGTLIPGETKG